MKYKLIDSMAHNWTHSFMSGMNYVGGEHVREDMYRLARERQGDRVTVTWIPERPGELSSLTPRIRESIRHYLDALPEYLSRHQVDPGAIAEMRTEVYVDASHRMHVRSYVLDARGTEHEQLVWP